MNENNIQKFGEKFNLQKYLNARQVAINICDKIAASAEVGWNEERFQNEVKLHYANNGITRFWHPTKVRIDNDTVKNFREHPNQELTLQEGSLFFLDIGPILEEHEADFGRTYVFGKNDEFNKLATDAEVVFEHCKKIWKESKLSGKDLYEVATLEANELGWILNLAMDGHRLGDFPHSLHFKGSLLEVEITTEPFAWVLEIHLLNQSKDRGAFFEDILF